MKFLPVSPRLRRNGELLRAPRFIFCKAQVASNPSRIDANRGDHFLQADFSVPIRRSNLDYFRIANHLDIKRLTKAARFLGGTHTRNALNRTR